MYITDFQKRMSANKLYEYITIDLNSLNRATVLDDSNEMNKRLNLMNDIKFWV